MYCIICGNELRNGANFCSSCGEFQKDKSEVKGIQEIISVVVYIDHIRLNISSINREIMDEIDNILMAQFIGNEFFASKIYNPIETFNNYHMDWFMPLDVSDELGWEDFLVNAFKSVTKYLIDNGFSYFPEKRLFEKRIG